MCGIAGILSANKTEISLNRLKQMTDAIRHRGPEGEGFWINPQHQLGFGHRRLAIIDLSERGEQPMHYAGRYTVIFNGEIYNYIELRKGLEKKGYLFRSETDTEVILAAYALHGERCLEHFDGMFAFAIWDEVEKVLFLARDRFGEKPLYYHIDPASKTFSFASEMKALWAGGIQRNINHRMMLTYFALGYVQNPADKSETFFEGIYSLPPACFIRININRPEIDLKKYYQSRVLETNPGSSLSEAKAIFIDLLNGSIARRLRSDVPLGTSLSGGLDSSSIASIITKIKAEKHPLSAPPLVTFSAVFPGYAKDESTYINALIREKNLKNYTVEPTAGELIDDFHKLCHYQEEPFPSSSIYTQYRVYQLAAEHGVTVILDGQGADEILAGYSKYIHWFLQELLASGHFLNFGNELSLFRKHDMPFEWSWKNGVAAFMPQSAAKILGKKTRSVVHQHPGISRDYVEAFFDASRLNKPVIRSLSDILAYNTFRFGLEELLRFADRNAMAHSREVRLPFLYHKLVEFAFTLPSRFKFHNGFSKYILRETMKQTVPPYVCWRTDKVGFEPPQEKWMADRRVQELIHESRKALFSQGILTKKAVEKKIQPREAHAAENFDWRYMVGREMILK